MIIDFLLDEYWTSSETKEYVDAAVSGISMDEYWTSAETKDYVDTVENHINSVEEVTSRALNDLNDRVIEISGSTVDLSPYWTSAETQSYVDNVRTELYDYVDIIDTASARAINEIQKDLNNIYNVTDYVVRTNYDTDNYIEAIWKGTQREYDDLTNEGADANDYTLYIITDNN